MGRRIRRKTPAEKTGQRFGVTHAGARLPVDNRADASGDLETVQLIGRSTVMPFSRAAGLHNKANVGCGGCIDHLLHIIGCERAFTFQIRTAEVHKNGPIVIRAGGPAQGHAQHDCDENCNGSFHSKKSPYNSAVIVHRHKTGKDGNPVRILVFPVQAVLSICISVVNAAAVAVGQGIVCFPEAIPMVLRVRAVRASLEVIAVIGEDVDAAVIGHVHVCAIKVVREG